MDVDIEPYAAEAVRDLDEFLSLAKSDPLAAEALED